jgi:hypothetical protein
MRASAAIANLQLRQMNVDKLVIPVNQACGRASALQAAPNTQPAHEIKQNN